MLHRARRAERMLMSYERTGTFACLGLLISHTDAVCIGCKRVQPCVGTVGAERMLMSFEHTGASVSTKAGCRLGLYSP